MPAYCKRCSLHIPDGVSKCRMCGTSLLATPPAPANLACFEDPPRKLSEPGFSKWLFFIGLSLIAAPVTRIFAIAGVEVPALFGEHGQAMLAQHPGLDNLLYFEIGSNALLAFAAVVLNVLFYRRKKSFPKSMLAYIIAILAFRLVVTGAIHSLFPGTVMIRTAYSLAQYVAWAGAMAACLMFDSDVEMRFQN